MNSPESANIPLPPKRIPKGRVTMYVDQDVIDAFKMLAVKECCGYQTLMNNALREFMNNYMPEEK